MPSFNPFDCSGSPTAVWWGLVAPSDIGLFVPGNAGPEFDFGWSWQIPITWSCHGRLTGSIEVLPTDANVIRGRFGYRYARRYFLVGFGRSFSGDGDTWSPELGLQFAHSLFTTPDPRGFENENETAAHLIVRTEFNSQFRGVTILLGWNVF